MIFGVADCCYELPSSLALLPSGEGSQNSGSLSPRERARVMGSLKIHIMIQQRLIFLLLSIPCKDN